MNRPGICGWLVRIASLRTFAVLTLAYVASAMLLMGGATADGSVAPLDLRFHYDVDTVYAVLHAFGEAGRHQYLISATTFDVIYPLVYSMLFAVWLTLLLDRHEGLRCTLMLMPFGILIADLFENGAIAMLILNYPEKLPLLAAFASWATTIKWTLAGLVIGIVVILTIRAGYRWLRTLFNAAAKD